MRKTHRAPALAVAAFVAAVAAVLLSGGPALATTTSIHGTQGEGTQVFWTGQHTNTFTHNGMSISPYNGTDCALPTLLVGARWTSTPGSSFAKTGTMNPGQSSAFKNVTTGSYQQGPGTFYLTTYLGDNSGGCANTIPTWTATLIFNVSN